MVRKKEKGKCRKCSELSNNLMVMQLLVCKQYLANPGFADLKSLFFKKTKK